MNRSLTTPENALALLQMEFPYASLKPDYGNYRDYTVVGYWLVLNARSKLFLVKYDGGVDKDAVRLFRDGHAYARDKKNRKAAEKRRVNTYAPTSDRDYDWANG